MTRKAVQLSGKRSGWHTRFSPRRPGSIPGPGAYEFMWWSLYRTSGISSGYSGFPPQHKTT
ncbi:hypothetical protein DPMN_067433 [Dreissena polymorpha]|uniref:Uncharacterized protein n=1 Tax=Dreissena polymorpha TaxID=45954 RepID=A0A9D3YXX9_DREPO|nr:hypothetical protein DPMN_067433 [Dreissena polymorpha]